MLQQQAHQEHMRRGAFEDLNEAILNRELMMLQQQAHQERMRRGAQEIIREILNREVMMLQQQTHQERMIPPTAPTGLSRYISPEELTRMRTETATADATSLQPRDQNQSLNHQQAHQGQLLLPSNPVGVSRQVIAEQLIRMRTAATRYDTLGIRGAQATAADALMLQSRNHDQQQAHRESMNQPTAPNDLSREVNKMEK